MSTPKVGEVWEVPMGSPSVADPPMVRVKIREVTDSGHVAITYLEHAVVHAETFSHPKAMMVEHPHASYEPPSFRTLRPAFIAVEDVAKGDEMRIEITGDGRMRHVPRSEWK